MRTALALTVVIGAAVTIWCLGVVGNGLAWVVRDGRYRNGIMFGALTLLAALCIAAGIFTRRRWRRLRGNTASPTGTT